MRGEAGLARYGMGLMLLAGAATTLAFAPYGFWPLAIVGPALLFLAWNEVSPGRAARLGFAFGTGLFLSGSWWLYIAVHEFGQAPAWLALFLLLALVALMASYYALLGFTATRLVPAGPRRWLVFLPAGWMLMEWLRGWLFSGFPWLQAGYAHSDNVLAGLAPVGGIHLVTLASAVSAGVLVTLICGQRAWRMLALACLAALWGAAAVLSARSWTEPVGEVLGIALVQGAISQDLKWQADNRERTLELYRELSRLGHGQQLIIWPEAALPVLAHEVKAYLAVVREEATTAGSELLIGLLHYDFESERYYNGLLALSKDGSAWYDKRRLVPFGEYFPVPATVRHWMRLMSLPYVDMSPGADAAAGAGHCRAEDWRDHLLRRRLWRRAARGAG